MSEQTVSPLLPFGAGIGVGLISLWALIELLPLLALGGVGFLIFKGLEASNITKEDTDTCSTGQQAK